VKIAGLVPRDELQRVFQQKGKKENKNVIININALKF
jgi:hypothetical protein